MTREISNSDDLIDSRDVIKRIKDLESSVETGDADDEEKAELTALKALAEEGECCGGWADGETLIHDSYFENYAREFADDVVIGYRKNSEQWPFNCIDWEKAARELQEDFMQLDFDGETYWMRM